MTLKDTSFAAAATVLALLGMAGIAASGTLADGNGAVSAQYLGFEALAQRVFDVQTGKPAP